MNHGIERGERRQVTAFFYDMVGSTTLVTTMDLEDYREIQRAIHTTAHRVIVSHGGHLDLLMGDGGSAYFGYPVAKEDAPQQAVAAGLALLKECADIQKDFEKVVPIRIGVATASAVVGPAGPGELSSREEVVGIAPTLAARIQGIAKVGTVVVSNATYRATRRLYDYEELGAHPIKGFGSPQVIWRPLSRKHTVDRFEALRESAHPLLARQSEITLAKQMWQSASQGRGQVIYIHGEPGIGKSRLSHKVVEHTLQQGSHLLDFQCEPACQDIPFEPFVKSLRAEVLKSEPDFNFDAPSGDALRKALTIPGEHPPGFYETLAFLIAPDANQAAAPAGDETGPALSPVETLVDAIMAIGSVQPCVLKVEDLHWADSQTLETLDHLLKHVGDAPVLVIITSREEPDKAWTGADNFTPLALTRLKAENISELVSNFAGKTPIPARLAKAIAERSEGVPLFAEELTRFVLDQGADRGLEEMDWEKLFDSEETASLQDLLAARLGALGPAKFVAQAASVIGRSFNILTLVALLGTNGAAATAEESLEQLISGGFLEERVSGTERFYHFRHVLLQQAAYSGLLRSNRRTLHTALYRIASADDVAHQPFTSAELAVHAEQAIMPREAIRHYIDAAKTASARSALKEARKLLARARLLTDELEDRTEAAELELEIVSLSGPVVATQEGAGSDEASALYARGVELLRELPDADRATGFPLYWGWWFTAGNFKIQRERAEHLLADLAGTNNAEVELQAHHCRWATAFNLGSHNDCLAAISKGLELYNEDEALDHRTRYGGHDARVCGLGELALSSWFIGQTEQAVTYMSQSEDWADHIAHVGSTCHALDIAIMLHRYRGDIDRVTALAGRMRAVATEHDLKSLEAKSLIFEGWAEGMSGDAARGRAKLHQGLSIQQDIGTEEDFPVYLEMAGELDGLLGRFEEGVETVTSAIVRAEEAEHAFWLAELYRRRARLLHSLKSGEAGVRADLDRAYDIAMGQNATVLALRAAVDRALLLPETVTPGFLDDTKSLLAGLETGEERDRAARLLSSLLA